MFLRLLFLLILSFTLANSSHAEEIGLVSKNTINDKIKAVELLKELAEEEKQKLLDTYAKTIEQVNLIDSFKQQRQAYINSRKVTPDKIKKLTLELEKLALNANDNKTENNSKLSLTKLELALESELAKQASISSSNSDIQHQLLSNSNNAAKIRKQLLETNNILDQLIDSKDLTISNTSDIQEQAIQWLNSAEIFSLRNKIKMINEQLLSQPNTIKLLKLKQRISDHKLKKIAAKVLFLENQIAIKRKLELQKTQETTRTEQIEAQDKHPIVQSFAQLNSQLSEDINLINRQLTNFEVADDKVNIKTKQLANSLSNTKKKLEIAGLNEILGQILLKQKYSLPNTTQYLRNLKNRKKLLTISGLKNIEYQEEQSQINQTHTYISQLIKGVSEDKQLSIKNDLADLVTTRKQLLIKAINLNDNYFKAIADLDFAEKKLIIIADKYNQLLDEYLLWLANAPILNYSNIINMPGQLISFLSATKLIAFSHDLIQMLSSSFILIPALLLLIFLLSQKNRLIKRLLETGLKTKKISKDKLSHTLKAIFYTLFLAIPMILVIALISWRLSITHDISDFSLSVSTALKTIILPLFFLQTFYYMCLPGGLFEVHFKWPQEITTQLSKEMVRLMFTLIPIIFFTVILFSQGDSGGTLNLARLSLLLTLLTFALFFYRMLKPNTGFIHSIGRNKGLFSHYQGIWFIVSQIVVLALISLTIAGYVYTAAQLTKSLIYSVCFIFILVLVQQVLMRWLLINRRRFALNLAYEKRKAKYLVEENKQALQEQNDTEGREHIMESAEPEIDIVSISEESTKLVNMLLIILGISGLVAIWSSILPAFAIFDKVQLWHHASIVNGTEKLLPITLGDLGFALMVMLITIVSAKRFPAIIEIILLQSTNINSGNRYTITTLINYTIIGIGFFSVFNILGAEWSKFQWLFAALSVGIGFGLQEIVANFISGIILLFERPIRVGDYVSVGENEGIVSRIRIRATTILTRDRKELLVPNKEFITGQLLNWSLSDPTTRLIIPVGVAYGSDVPKAKQILIDCATENECVLKEPQPKVIFYNFGDNTLDLQLRCFITDVDFRLNTISQLNEEINKRFEAANINISFPQRDVHLDINQPIDVRFSEQK